MTTLTQRIKEIAMVNNLDYFGVAPAESLRNEPEEERPEHLLPGARSVISLGIKLGLGVQWANKLAHTDQERHHAIYSYLWHGFGLLSLHYIDRTSILITRLLEKEGYLAVPVMSASTFDVRGSLMHFSNFHAAVAAGQGELGWGNLVMTPDAGPRVRFGSVITNVELEVNPLYSGPRLCDPSKCKKSGNGMPVCANVCPTKAISLEEEKVAIGDKVVKVAKIDTWKCTWGSMGLSKSAGGLKDIPMPDKVDADAVFHGLGQRDPVQAMELMVIGRGDYCGRCIMECPVARSPKLDELLKVK
jgi:epoxyqueuosine reductase QueG